MNSKEIANGALLSPTSAPPEESDSNEARERTGYKGMYTAVRQMWDPQFGRPCSNDNQPDLEQNAPVQELSRDELPCGFGIYPVDTGCPNCHEDVTSVVDKELRDSYYNTRRDYRKLVKQKKTKFCFFKSTKTCPTT